MLRPFRSVRPGSGALVALVDTLALAGMTALLVTGIVHPAPAVPAPRLSAQVVGLFAPAATARQHGWRVGRPEVGIADAAGPVEAVPPPPPAVTPPETAAALPPLVGPGERAVEWALAQLGHPYQYGASGPVAFDCSGLALRAWGSVGAVLPRVAAAQYDAGPHFPLAEAEPGDLVFFGGSPASIGHVGLFVGDGLMVEAPHTGLRVRISSIYVRGLLPDVTRPQVTSGALSSFAVG